MKIQIILVTLVISGGLVGALVWKSDKTVLTPPRTEVVAHSSGTTIDNPQQQIERVLAQLAQEMSVSLVLPDGVNVEDFKTLGRLSQVEEASVKNDMLRSRDVLAGNLTDSGARYQFQQIIAELDLLDNGRYWVLPAKMQDGMRIALRIQAAVPGLICVFWPLDADERGCDRTVVFPLVTSDHPGFSQAAQEHIANTRLTQMIDRYNAMDRKSREQLLRPESEGSPLVVPEGGMKTRLGVLPAGTSIDADLLISLPKPMRR